MTSAQALRAQPAYRAPRAAGRPGAVLALVPRSVEARGRLVSARQAAREWLLQLTTAAILLLNLLDGVFTLIWVRSRQADEANPIMAGFLRQSPLAFLVAKLTLVSVGALFLWRHRARRLAAGGLLLAGLVYAVIVAEHLAHVQVLAEMAR
jgi:hypothetical protein